MTRVLIVEDNADLAFGLRRTLEFEGYEVQVAEDGESGLEKARSGWPELVVLDLMLPGMDGFNVLRKLRAAGRHLPVLILTARGDESDVVLGFDSGADDYVTKPFSTLEFLARVRALLRRGNGAGTDENGGPMAIEFGSVEVHPRSHRVFRSGNEVSLAPKEYDLLMALLRRQGGVASRSELLGEVWEYGYADVPTRTVDVHVAELRRKLEDDPANPRHILTVRKAGYRLEP